MTYVLEASTRRGALAVCLALAIGCQPKHKVPFAPFDVPPSDGGSNQGTDGGSKGSAGTSGTAQAAQLDAQLAQLQDWGGGVDDPDKLCVGQDHTCAIDKQGMVHCWGDSKDVPDGLPPMVEIVCGDVHTCARDADGNVACWGRGSDPAKAEEARKNPSNPALYLEQGQAIPPQMKFKQISAGGAHTCGIDLNDEVVCWGAGTKDKMNGFQPNFSQGTVPAGKFKQVSAGQVHTCAVASNGDVLCWGAGDTSATCFPPRNYECGQASSPPGKFVAVASGDMHSCALDMDGAVQCWGRGTTSDNCNVLSGENAYDCGQASPPTSMVPFVKLRAGWEFNCALTQDYALKCWGWNDYGMLKVPPMAKFAQMSLGDSDVCGLQVKGVLSCWGTANLGATDVPPGIP